MQQEMGYLKLSAHCTVGMKLTQNRWKQFRHSFETVSFQFRFNYAGSVTAYCL